MTPIVESLTEREEQVLARIADGRSYREIGAALGIKFSTVRAHRDSARAKLGAASTPHAVAIFIRARAAAPVPA